MSINARKFYDLFKWGGRIKSSAAVVAGITTDGWDEKYDKEWLTQIKLELADLRKLIDEFEDALDALSDEDEVGE